MVQRAFSIYLHGDCEDDNMDDSDWCDSSSDVGSILDKDALQVVWLSLDKWWQATGFTSLAYENIVDYYMGEDKGFQDYSSGKWYKILPYPLEPQSLIATSTTADHTSAASSTEPVK